MKTAFIIFFVLILLSLNAKAQQTFNSLNVKELAVNGQLNVNSTTKGSKPCPAMTQTQRNAIASPASGQCIYNTSTLSLNVYNGTVWKAAGGGLDNWLTATTYSVGDVVIQSSKIYQCSIAHTSGTFATDLAASRWSLISPITLSESVGTLSLSNGGTNKSLAASNGAIAYTDTDSLELLPAGTAGQILQTNGAAAPSFVNKSISAKSEIGSSVTVEEIQVPNNLLTETATGKFLSETGNLNMLVNPNGEHLTAGTGWSCTTTGPACQVLSSTSTTPELGKKHLRFRCDGTVGGAGTCSFFQDAATTSGSWGKASIKLNLEGTTTARVFPRRNGSKLTDQITASGENWNAEYKIPFQLGTTSSGIHIETTVTAIESPFIEGDAAYVGIDNVTANVPVICKTAACETTFVFFQASGGAVSNENHDFINGNCSLGGTTYTCNFNTSFFSSTPVCTQAENGALLTGVNLSSLTATGMTYNTAAAGANSSAVGVWWSCTRSGSDYTAAINAQERFTQIYSTTCGANCVDTFSAAINGTSFSNQNVQGWISSVTNPSTGTYTITFQSGLFTVAPNCWGVGQTSSFTAVFQDFGTTPSSATTYIFRPDAGNIAVNAPFRFFCQKQGADFTASRTIVGSFKDIPTTPSAGRLDIFSVSFNTSGSNCTSSPCTIDQIGNLVSSVNRSGGGQYVLNTAKTYSKLRCSLSAARAGSAIVTDGAGSCNSCSSLTWFGFNLSSTPSDWYGTFNCMGQLP